MEIGTSDVFREGMATAEVYRVQEGMQLNSQHCDETQRKVHERDRLRTQYRQTKNPTNELWSPESQYLSIKTYFKEIRFAVAFSVPGYKESCTSVFTEKFRLTGDFCPSTSGIVTAPAVDSRATARFDAVDVISGCRTRLRELQQTPDG